MIFAMIQSTLVRSCILTRKPKAAILYPFANSPAPLRGWPLGLTFFNMGAAGQNQNQLGLQACNNSPGGDLNHGKVDLVSLIYHAYSPILQIL